jgi:AraC-like DNA-binding protein
MDGRLMLNSTAEACGSCNGEALPFVTDQAVSFDDDKALVERCVSLIEAHLECEDFNVQTLTRLIGLSHSVLYRRIKQISGLAVNPFVRLIRLRKAAKLIAEGEMNISECAMAVGIYDIKYFRQQFVKMYGETPSEYGRRLRLTVNE